MFINTIITYIEKYDPIFVEKICLILDLSIYIYNTFYLITINYVTCHFHFKYEIYL